jgi:hypothetical protein
MSMCSRQGELDGLEDEVAQTSTEVSNIGSVEMNQRAVVVTVCKPV